MLMGLNRTITTITWAWQFSSPRNLRYGSNWTLWGFQKN